jgi:hypothetical protein
MARSKFVVFIVETVFGDVEDFLAAGAQGALDESLG